MRRTALTLVTLMAPVLAGTPALAMTVQQQEDFTSAGATMSFTFNNLPPPTNNDVTVTVDLLGDYTGASKYATVTIGNKQQPDHLGGSGCSTAPDSEDYVLSKSIVQNGTLKVVVANSSAVTASCTTSPNRVVVSVSYQAKPDLLPESITAPEQGSTDAAGDSFSVRFGVRCWHEPLTTDFNVNIAHCPQQNAYACVSLGDKLVTDDFQQGETRYFESAMLAVPESAALGKSYVQVTVDSAGKVNEAVETNNVAYAEITLTAKPDLSPTAATVPSAGSTAAPGSQFLASYTVSNAASTSAVTQSFVMDYSYCTAADKSTCTLLAQQTISGDVYSGADYTFTSPALTIPSSAVTGTAHILAEVDTGSAVEESDESNNERFDPITVTGIPEDAGPLPDLGVDGPALDLLPVTDLAGGADDGGWTWPDLGQKTPDAALDAGTDGGQGKGTSGCAVAHRRSDGPSAPLLLLLAGLAIRRRFRRR